MKVKNKHHISVDGDDLSYSKLLEMIDFVMSNSGFPTPSTDDIILELTRNQIEYLLDLFGTEKNQELKSKHYVGRLAGCDVYVA